MRAVLSSRWPTPWVALAVLVTLHACAEPADAPTAPDLGKASSGPTVSSTNPPEAPRDTTLDVTVLGSGFDAGSRVDFLLNGAADAKVRTNSTRYVSSRELVASITIDADAVPDFRDVLVTTTTGKKGIGTEMFEVLVVEALETPSGGSARDVTASGMVVGGAYDLGCDGGSLPARWDGSVMSFLPLPAGDCWGLTHAMSANGFATGRTNDDPGTPVTLVRWIPGPAGYQVETLSPEYLGGSIFDNMGINSAGHVVAFAQLGSSDWRPLWWSSETGWGELEKPAGADRCTATALADSDAIAGSCYFNSIGYTTYWASPQASPQVLPRLPDRNSHHHATAINEAGVIVGYAWNRTKSGTFTAMAVRWQLSGASWTAEALGHLGGGESEANDINADGAIVGWTRTTKGGPLVAFIWTAGAGMRRLGGLSSNADAEANGIADRSSDGTTLVVGYSVFQGKKLPVVWRQ